MAFKGATARARGIVARYPATGAKRTGIIPRTAFALGVGYSLASTPCSVCAAISPRQMARQGSSYPHRSVETETSVGIVAFPDRAARCSELSHQATRSRTVFASWNIPTCVRTHTKQLKTTNGHERYPNTICAGGSSAWIVVETGSSAFSRWYGSGFVDKIAQQSEKHVSTAKGTKCFSNS
jgi:hypothetical protein